MPTPSTLSAALSPPRPDNAHDFIAWMRGHSLSPKRTTVRRDAESAARKLLDTRAGRMNVKEGYELARLLNTDWKNGKVTHRRFAPAFQGASYNEVMSNLDAFNRYVGRLWRQDEDGALQTLGDIVRRRVDFRGAGRSLPSVLLYLRNPTKYAVWINATVAGLNALTRDHQSVGGRTGNDYLVFSRAAARLRRAHKLAPQEMDVVLAAAGQAAEPPKLYTARPSEVVRRPLRCFIAGSLETNTAPLRNALILRNIGWVDSASASPHVSLVDSVVRAIESSDIVCAVLDSSHDQTQVTFEVGVAVAKGIPVFLFADPPATLPKMLRDLPYALIGIENIEALNLHLDLFLNQARPRAIEHERVPDPLHDMTNADTHGQLEGTGRSAAPRDGSQFERAVMEAFEEAGYLASSARGERPIEIAVWIDELDSSVGNPTLVEVKAQTPSSRMQRQIGERLRARVVETRSGAGLLIYRDDPSGLPRTDAKLPVVLTLSFSELTTLLDGRNLGQAIRDARKRVVHGMA